MTEPLSEEDSVSAYAQIRTAYRDVDPRMRSRVRHRDTGRCGEIIPPLAHLNAYVRVRFDGEHEGTNCHPLSLEYGLMPKELSNSGVGPMTTIDVKAMSLPELRNLEGAVKVAIERALETERAAVVQKMREEAAAHGFKLSDIFALRAKHARKKPVIIDIRTVLPAAAKAVKASNGRRAAKYANPRKQSETWSGRGRRPLWLVRQLKRPGAKLEAFAVRHA